MKSEYCERYNEIMNRGVKEKLVQFINLKWMDVPKINISHHERSRQTFNR